jgi:hypothetical protein
MRNHQSLLSLRIAHNRWLHDKTCIRPCCAALGQCAWVDDEDGFNDLVGR